MADDAACSDAIASEYLRLLSMPVAQILTSRSLISNFVDWRGIHGRCRPCAGNEGVGMGHRCELGTAVKRYRLPMAWLRAGTRYSRMALKPPSS